MLEQERPLRRSPTSGVFLVKSWLRFLLNLSPKLIERRPCSEDKSLFNLSLVSEVFLLVEEIDWRWNVERRNKFDM